MRPLNGWQRLWVVLTVTWLVIVAALTWPTIRDAADNVPFGKDPKEMT